MFKEIIAVPAEPEKPEMNSEVDINGERLQGETIEGGGS